ncbi:MAG TPA: TetR/AcrR family transcriptional regulator [Polyangiales bacterium]|nr:TetR/AcrR family transcriptional regulator [Polyangiales bacterium]
MSRKAEIPVRLDVPAPADPVRTRILRGAAKVFGERGYGGSSVEAILDAARVSRRTFYRTFRSKEDVLRTLFDNSVQMLIRAVREASAGERRAPESAGSAVEAYLRVHANAGPLARVLLLEQFSPGSPLAEQRNRAFATFSKLMTAAATRGGRGPADPLLVTAVVAAINQVCVQMATEFPSGNWDVARAKRAILRILSVLDEPSPALD